VREHAGTATRRVGEDRRGSRNGVLSAKIDDLGHRKALTG
jgi:hypothetical protein